MKKFFSKVLVLVLTVSMLFGVCAVGVNAATPSITLTQSSYTYGYGGLVEAVLNNMSAAEIAQGVTWSYSNPNGIIYEAYKDSTRLYLTSSYGVNVTVTATSKANTAVSSSITVAVSAAYMYPDATYPWMGYPSYTGLPSDWWWGTGSYPSYPGYPGDWWWGTGALPVYPGYPSDWWDLGYYPSDWWWGTGDWWVDYPGSWWWSDGYYPSFGLIATSSIKIGTITYPWCGGYNQCRSAGCVHSILENLSAHGYSGNHTYCSAASCNWCGKPLNHHGWEWIYNNLTNRWPDAHIPSAVEKLEDYTAAVEADTGSELDTILQRWYNKYSDVDRKMSYYNAVRFVDVYEYMTSTGKAFGINSEITRSEFVEALGKFADIVPAKYTSTFADVTATNSYAPYAAWAVQSGFISATEDGKFSPTDAISRDEAVTAIYKYVQSLKASVEVADKDSVIDKYKDADSIDEASFDAFDWALANDILVMSGTRIGASQPLVKVRLAQMLYAVAEYLS